MMTNFELFEEILDKYNNDFIYVNTEIMLFSFNIEKRNLFTINNDNIYKFHIYYDDHDKNDYHFHVNTKDKTTEAIFKIFSGCLIEYRTREIFTSKDIKNIKNIYDKIEVKNQIIDFWNKTIKNQIILDGSNNIIRK